MKLLYVEDNPIDADLTRVALKKFGDEFQVTFVKTCEEALQELLLASDHSI